jgi:hypothetical protein
VLGLLDALQAAERAGADAVGEWIGVCRHAGLRGGLKVIRERDRRHAALSEARLRALGGVPAAAISRELEALCAVLADAGISDHSKLSLLVNRFPAAASSPLGDVAQSADGDAETRALLQAIDDDERISLAWLRRVREVVAAGVER